ncbi:MAG: GntR family transcriptional regulator [Spirochaetota bacterium]
MVSTAYTKLYNVLRERILNRQYISGQKLPTERELCEQFGISRITIRHALRLLQEQGLVAREPGRGTFVRSIKPKKVPIIDSDYVGSLKKEAPNIKRKLLTYKIEKPPAHITDALGLFKMEECLFAERLDLLEDEPLAYDRAYIPVDISKSITKEMLVRVDFLKVWLDQENIKISHLKESIEAIAADKTASVRLHVPLHGPMLLAIDQVHGVDERMLAVFETIYRGDRFKLISTRHWE